eukprot:14906550-Alexandrium_andersonii.AAC.1
MQRAVQGARGKAVGGCQDTPIRNPRCSRRPSTTATSSSAARWARHSPGRTHPDRTSTRNTTAPGALRRSASFE